MTATHRVMSKALYRFQLVDEGTEQAWVTGMGRQSIIERVAHLMCETYLGPEPLGLPLSPVRFAPGATPTRRLARHDTRPSKSWSQGVAARWRYNVRARSLLVTNLYKLIHIAGFDENYLHKRFCKWNRHSQILQ
jgi:hypothetical protein